MSENDFWKGTANKMPADVYFKVKEQMVAIKHDTGKPDLAIIPIEALEAITEAMAYGANKYGRNNFKGGFKHLRLANAALRHIFAWVGGETMDKESGLSHISHAIASLAMLAWTIKHRPDLDDRS
jgi:hypothetical protein